MTVAASGNMVVASWVEAGVGSWTREEGVGVAAAGAAPGRRRAALGANFLPVVFSMSI